MGAARIKGHLTSRIHKFVRFGAPKDVHNKQGSPARGKIVDEVWIDEEINRSAAHRQPCQNGIHCWGDYSFCAQLIKWDVPSPDGDYSVRLAYYRRRCGEDWWEYASQTTVTSGCADMHKLLESTLAKTSWFSKQPGL